MSYTLRGRLESRLASSLVPLLLACVLAGVLRHWWPLEIAGLMIGVGLALDVDVYHRFLDYQPGWLALPLGLLELGIVTGLAHLLMIMAPTSAAIGFFVGSWALAQALGHAGFPLWRLSYAEDGGELGRLAAPVLVAVTVAVLAAAAGVAWSQRLPTVQTPTFADVTGPAGLVTTVAASTCGAWAAGAAWGDVSGDGQLDLFLPRRGARARLWIGDGTGHFWDRAADYRVANVGPSPAGASLVDYDNDGARDLFVFGEGGNRLFHGRPGRTFTDVTGRSGLAGGGNATSAAWGDYDRDGRLDVFVTNYGHCGPFGLDSFNPGKSRLYHNEGHGRFREVTRLLEGPGGTTRGFGFQGAWFDYNHDGRPDLYLGNDRLGPRPEPNHLWRNDGPGPGGRWRFTDVSVPSGTKLRMNTMGIAIGDYDRNGRLDLALSNMDPNRLLRNNGDGTFTDVARSARVDSPSLSGGMAMGEGHSAAEMASMPTSDMPTTWGTGFYDFNLDGWEDLYFAAGATDNPVAMHNQLFVNVGGGRFADRSTASGADDPSSSRGVALADYDGDGRMDMYVVNQGGIPKLLHNETDPRGRHWLEVRLVGTTSNRDGCGARVTASAAGAQLLREVSCGSTSFASWSDPTLHFGLAGTARVARLAIEWPSGTNEVLRNVAADRLLVVRERLP